MKKHFFLLICCASLLLLGACKKTEVQPATRVANCTIENSKLPRADQTVSMEYALKQCNNPWQNPTDPADLRCVVNQYLEEKGIDATFQGLEVSPVQPAVICNDGCSCPTYSKVHVQATAAAVVKLTAIGFATPTVNSDDYFIIGSFAGFCGGETCMETFLFKNASFALNEDINDPYPTEQTPFTAWNFSTPIIDSNKQNAVNNLIPLATYDLRNYPSQVFGTPDAYDQGGLFIELKENGVTKRWIFDTNPATTPQDLVNLKSNLATVLDLLKH